MTANIMFSISQSRQVLDRSRVACFTEIMLRGRINVSINGISGWGGWDDLVKVSTTLTMRAVRAIDLTVAALESIPIIYTDVLLS
jgi:hypothetical protein